MTSVRVLLVPAVVLGLALGSAAAASAAPTGSSSGAALTPAAYRAQASALCVQARKRIAGLPKSSSAKHAAVATALSKALDALQPLLASFRKLEPPAAFKVTHDKTVKGLADGLGIGHQIADSIARGSDLQKAMQKVQAPFLLALSSIQSGFQGLGLAKCESVLGSAIGGA